MSRQQLFSIGRLGLVGLCMLAHAQAQDDVEVLHAEPLALTTVATQAGATKPAAVAGEIPSRHRRVAFAAFGRAFELELEPNERLEQLRTNRDETVAAVAFRGTIAGNADSWVRLVLGPAGPAGLIWDGQRYYGVEHAGDSAATQRGAVIFRLDDVYIAPGALSCATGETGLLSGKDAIAALTAELDVAALQGATLNLDLGAVADSQFANQHGGDTENALLTRFNNVDGIFSEQLGVQISVPQIDILTGAEDPFTTTGASDLLDELAFYRAATPAQDAQGLTHLFTGKNLDGTTVGIAYIGTLCARKNPFDGRSYGAGLTEGRHGSLTDSLIAAHEIGHNFGAPHDNEADSACESTPDGYLMAPSVSGSDQFSDCSIEQMQPEIAAAGCLTPIPQADLSLSSATAQPAAGVGESLDYDLSVRNLGTESASNVAVHAELAAGAELAAATFASGSCTVATTSADCTTPSIPAGALRTLRLTVTAAQPGSYALSAVATADVDAAASNDTIADTVTFEPTIDLTLTGNGNGTSLEQGEAATLTFELANAGGFEATGLTLTVALGEQLRADGVSLGGNACALGSSPIACNAASLAARASVPLVVELTGLAAGSPAVSLEATAAERETHAADNRLVRVVDVAASAPTRAASSGSGGGSAGLGWLALVALLPGSRRRLAALCQYF